MSNARCASSTLARSSVRFEERFDSRAAALQAEYESIFVPGAPDVLVVTAGWLEALAQRRGTPLPELAKPEPVRPDERKAELEAPAVVWGYDRQGRPIVDFDEWARLRMDDNYFRVARTDITDTVYVSTVWLGQDHALYDDDKPVIFETKCFKRPRQDIGGTRRYCTEDEAVKGHAAVVKAMLRLARRRPRA